MKKILLLLYLVIFSINGFTADLIVVPSARVAEEVATIVLTSIYGKVISKQTPFLIKEKDGYWYVDGQLPKSPRGFVVVGGIVHCEIRKSDGAFRNIIHGK